MRTIGFSALIAALALPALVYAAPPVDAPPERIETGEEWTKPPPNDGYFPNEYEEPTDGYLPDSPPPGHGPEFSLAPPQRFLRVGINLGLGSHIPIAGDTHDLSGRQEFTATADFGGGIFFLMGNVVQLDLNARGGFGGVSSSFYEERYGYTHLQPRHVWVGGHLRVFPVDIFGVQPFVSAQLGADRVFAARMDGTGIYECTDDGYSIRCEEEEERTFAAGYWGASAGLGAGIRFARQEWPIAVSAEAMWMRNQYSVRTTTGLPNDRLAETSPSTRNLGLMLMLHVPLS